ncbi:type II toxin-antitoxin system Phd/YefM family antitoxin [Eisenbergiella tayi]|uniref:Type II toxin-antitoxin system Phd/YefM family antitoxin n=1 Tax=Eisenbergiella porci TaxID=2652274 RepID=A0A6N7WN96_9FIRM|nr:type II toxin-antitoxin system Phd/YefM family antitoxin [Eisenbergiella porci]MSS92073.1 type II toxin-antitoxin system Phd/YefM family antitoxin [Eisenbergiella porci]
MSTVMSAIQNTISISLFNRGLAGKIFDEVKKYGAKVVMKNNTPECVLMSPAEYVELMNEVNDARLLTIASERIANFDSTKLVSMEAFDKEFGFTETDLADSDEVEFE